MICVVATIVFVVIVLCVVGSPAEEKTTQRMVDRIREFISYAVHKWTIIGLALKFTLVDRIIKFDPKLEACSQLKPVRIFSA